MDHLLPTDQSDVRPALIHLRTSSLPSSSFLSGVISLFLSNDVDVKTRERRESHLKFYPFSSQVFVAAVVVLHSVCVCVFSFLPKLADGNATRPPPHCHHPYHNLIPRRRLLLSAEAFHAFIKRRDSCKFAFWKKKKKTIPNRFAFNYLHLFCFVYI